MQCFVYKGDRRPDTYLYLPVEDDFSAVPEPLRRQLGELSLALQFDLGADRRLAQADADTVRAALADPGYYLQVPPPAASLIDTLPNRPDA